MRESTIKCFDAHELQTASQYRVGEDVGLDLVNAFKLASPTTAARNSPANLPSWRATSGDCGPHRLRMQSARPAPGPLRSSTGKDVTSPLPTGSRPHMDAGRCRTNWGRHLIDNVSPSRFGALVLGPLHADTPYCLSHACSPRRPGWVSPGRPSIGAVPHGLLDGGTRRSHDDRPQQHQKDWRYR